MGQQQQEAIMATSADRTVGQDSAQGLGIWNLPEGAGVSGDCMWEMGPWRDRLLFLGN